MLSQETAFSWILFRSYLKSLKGLSVQPDKQFGFTTFLCGPVAFKSDSTDTRVISTRLACGSYFYATFYIRTTETRRDAREAVARESNVEQTPQSFVKIETMGFLKDPHLLFFPLLRSGISHERNRGSVRDMHVWPSFGLPQRCRSNTLASLDIVASGVT